LGSLDINLIHWDHHARIKIGIQFDLGLGFRTLYLATNIEPILFLLKVKSLRHISK
jgi:hypothetical protein